MVLRSGAKVGPVGGRDWAAAAAGVMAVVVLVVFVVVAGTRDGYSHVDDTISQLGAHGTPGVWWFFAVNVAGALLIVVFAYGTHRRLPVGLATGAFLGAVAFGALLVGAFPCSGECLPRTSDAHGVAAAFTAFMIVGFLVAAAWGLRRAWRLHRTGPRWLRCVTYACAGANVLLGLALLTRDADAGDVRLARALVLGLGVLVGARRLVGDHQGDAAPRPPSVRPDRPATQASAFPVRLDPFRVRDVLHR